MTPKQIQRLLEDYDWQTMAFETVVKALEGADQRSEVGHGDPDYFGDLAYAAIDALNLDVVASMEVAFEKECEACGAQSAGRIVPLFRLMGVEDEKPIYPC